MFLFAHLDTTLESHPKIFVNSFSMALAEQSTLDVLFGGYIFLVVICCKDQNFGSSIGWHVWTSLFCDLFLEFLFLFKLPLLSTRFSFAPSIRSFYFLTLIAGLTLTSGLVPAA